MTEQATMALTGIEPRMLRSAASDPGFLSGVVDYLLSDERLLVVLNITGESYRMRAHRARADKLRRGDGTP